MKDVCCSILLCSLSTGECATQKAFRNISVKGALFCGNLHILSVEKPAKNNLFGLDTVVSK